MTSDVKNTEEFRDHLSTADTTGKRIWIYPKKPKGRYYNARTIVSIILLALLFGLPFIKLNGDPLFLLNVLEGRFIIFGIIFTPQDLFMFALAMITLILFIVLFTVVFGRLFCGWVCPQTIFMEMVFRKIEYWIEGDANQQRKLDKAPWTTKKIGKKALKHAIFISIAILIANTFLSYIIGVDEVIRIVSEPVRMHYSGFIAMLVFSGLFYFVFSRFREQVCIAVCPYGRLQGVLLVKESIVVVYDWIRGEPRGKIRKKKKTDPVAMELPVLGDCVDCHLCVKVCPTGIDIRNGTQLECVNCTACMDVCDEVMVKTKREKGLIRYDSVEGIESGKKKIFTPRVWAYSAVLLLLIIVQLIIFSQRTDVETLILRTPGMLYQKVEEDRVSNLYNYQVINKTDEAIENIEFRLVDTEGEIQIIGEVQDIVEFEISEGSFFIILDKADLKGRKTNLNIDVYADGELISSAKTNFLGPVN